MPAIPPSPLPQPTLGCHDSGACGRQARSSRGLAQMGDKVKWLQGWPHGQRRAANKLQQKYGQGAAGMMQECPGWDKRLQERPWATQKRGRAAVTPQEKPGAAFEPQEMRVVAQLPEARVSGVAKPLPQVAEPPQSWVGSLAQPPQDAPARCVPPNLLASCMLMARQPPLPPPRWLHLFLGGLPLLPLLPPGASKPAFCPSRPGAATPPIQWAPYPGPSS